MARGMWAVEPDGNIRDGSQLKTVVWTWDKTWLGQPYGDLCELGGMLRGDLGGSWEIVCIRMLE